MREYDIECVLKNAEQLVLHDETELAIKVLNALPAYYRDHLPQRILDMRRDIKSKIFTISDYALNPDDGVDLRIDFVQRCLALKRGNVIYQELLKANANGVIPHIVDFGPGEYWMALGLNRMNLKFTYHPIGIQPDAALAAKQELEAVWATRDIKERPNWFVAYEIIEHLHYVDELRDQYDRIKGDVTKVFLSTPMYTFAEGNPTWRERGIPHLRAYTPQEFYAESMRLFKEYKFEFIPDAVMVCVGSKEGKPTNEQSKG